MQRTNFGLKNNANNVDLRISLIAQKRDLVNKRRIKTTNTLKGRLELIKRLKRQNQHWEKMWKIIERQLKMNQNPENKKSLQKALKICEENFRKTDATTIRIKQKVKDDLKGA